MTSQKYDVTGSIMTSLLFLSTVLEDPGELEVIEIVVLDGSLPEHFIYLLLCEPVPHRCEQLPQVVLVDLATVIIVEALESVPDHFLGIGSVQLLTEHCQEHREVDRAWRFCHHTFKVLIREIFSQ